MLDGNWNVEQTSAAAKTVLAAKPPRGYEKLFVIEKLQEMAAAGQDPTEVTRLAVRAIRTRPRRHPRRAVRGVGWFPATATGNPASRGRGRQKVHPYRCA
jgi:hypothetical protein